MITRKHCETCALFDRWTTQDKKEITSVARGDIGSLGQCKRIMKRSGLPAMIWSKDGCRKHIEREAIT